MQKGGLFMEEMQNVTPVTNDRRKRNLTPFEKFSQSKLPLIIVGIALVLILIFVVGSVIQGFQYRTLVKQLTHEAKMAAKEEQARLNTELADLADGAAELAKQYDYKGAIKLLESFSGDRREFPALDRLIEAYESELATLVQWTDFSSIPNLSFEMLIADPQRAFSNTKYGSSYKKNFITTEEFKLILEQLYKNDYILISLDHLYEYTTTDTGASYFVEKELLIPEGKKPLLLTQTQLNYNLYMVDSDGDMVADAGGAGFASKLILDDNGNWANEFVAADGTLEVGAYDLIPILESFIATHPDFSYRGARATVALTGYNGLFGYRTHSEALKKLGDEVYNQEVEQAKKIAQALQNAGYTLACYTYENKDYSKLTTDKIKADLSGWTAEVVPILGKIDTFVFAKNADLAPSTSDYTSDSYHVLDTEGFKFYLGYCKDGAPWSDVNDQYVRQGRIAVTASNIQNQSNWFADLFDPATVLLAAR
jgi:hypothetical protein